MLFFIISLSPCKHFKSPNLFRCYLKVKFAVPVCAEDIANPKHPLRFHQFINNMKRSTPHPPAAPQDVPKATPPTETEPQASPSDQQAQQPQNASEEAGHDRHADVSQTAQDPAYASTDTCSLSTSGKGNVNLGPKSSSSTMQESMGTSTGTATGTEQGLMNLVPYDVMSRTLSRGGPMPGGQVCTAPCLHALHCNHSSQMRAAAVSMLVHASCLFRA